MNPLGILGEILLRLKDVKLLASAGIDRVGERGFEKIVGAVVDDVGGDGCPIGQRLGEIRARP